MSVLSSLEKLLIEKKTSRERGKHPTTNGGMQKRNLSWSTNTLDTRVCTFGADLYTQSVLINKISASELRRKFIKGALLVG